jgi:gliding motility-associated-like protein
LISVISCNETPQNINVPNSFSPNADGINDFFVIDGIPANAQLTIFNRAGKKLFATDNYQNEWNGKDQDGNNLETGTYWYVLKLPGIRKVLKGFIYLKK